MDDDPVRTDPERYAVLWENEFVRVLEYTDQPGARTNPHEHPNSVMITLSDFRRRLEVHDEHRELEMTAGRAVWLPAQRHSGENIGTTPTHAIFVELKGVPAAGHERRGSLGPQID